MIRYDPIPSPGEPARKIATLTRSQAMQEIEFPTPRIPLEYRNDNWIKKNKQEMEVVENVMAKLLKTCFGFTAVAGKNIANPQNSRLLTFGVTPSQIGTGVVVQLNGQTHASYVKSAPLGILWHVFCPHHGLVSRLKVLHNILHPPLFQM
jgi:hypothetical protein